MRVKSIFSNLWNSNHQYLPNRNQQRFHGLDTLRAIAIIIVLIYHYRVVVSKEDIFGFMSQLGWTGVDLFFVLSGYLIGNQILSALAKGHDFSLNVFYIRRFLRTLPNYYVVLALYFMFPSVLGGTATASIWYFLSFTQNLNMHPGETFTHSWSLCIEEQFYIIFPVVALLILGVKRSPVLAWSIIFGATVFAMALRGFNWYIHGQAAITGSGFWNYIYYPSYTRFDELLPGIAIALLKNFHPHIFEKIIRRGNMLLALGLVSVGVMFYALHNYFYIDGYGFSGVAATFSYSLLAISFSLLVMAALSPYSLLYRIRIPGAASLALWSYAIYLIHKPVFQIFKTFLPEQGISVDHLLGVTIVMIVSVVCGWLLYQFVETPFMNLREQFYPAHSKKDMISRDEIKTAV